MSAAVNRRYDASSSVSEMPLPDGHPAVSYPFATPRGIYRTLARIRTAAASNAASPRIGIIFLVCIALVCGWAAHGTLASTLAAQSSQARQQSSHARTELAAAAVPAAAAAAPDLSAARDPKSLTLSDASDSYSVSPVPSSVSSVTPVDTSTSAYMLEHGIDIGLGHRLKPFSAATVQLFRDKVTAGGLLEGAGNTLFVGVVNFGYIDLALTWICFARMHNLKNFLLGAVDEQSVNRLTELGYGAHVILLADLLNQPELRSCGGGKTHNFGSRCFVVQVRTKESLVLASLLAGYDTILSDMDISFIKNPLLYMPMSHSVEVQLETPTNTNPYCTGYHYNQVEGGFALRLHAEVLHRLSTLSPKDGDFGDQPSFNRVAEHHHHYQPDYMTQHIFGLDPILFPNGNSRYGRPDAVLHHNNWLSSAKEKRQRMRANGFYLYDEAGTSAAVSRGVEAGSNALVCRVCQRCKSFVPSQPQYRLEFPGPAIEGRDANKYGTSVMPPMFKKTAPKN